MAKHISDSFHSRHRQERDRHDLNVLLRLAKYERHFSVDSQFSPFNSEDRRSYHQRRARPLVPRRWRRRRRSSGQWLPDQPTEVRPTSPHLSPGLPYQAPGPRENSFIATQRELSFGRRSSASLKSAPIVLKLLPVNMQIFNVDDINLNMYQRTWLFRKPLYDSHGGLCNAWWKHNHFQRN